MESKEILVDPEKGEWEKIALPGIRIKYLYKNEQTGAYGFMPIRQRGRNS